MFEQEFINIAGILVVLTTTLRFIRHRRALLRQTLNVYRIMPTTLNFIMFSIGMYAIFDYCRALI